MATALAPTGEPTPAAPAGRTRAALAALSGPRAAAGAAARGIGATAFLVLVAWLTAGLPSTPPVALARAVGLAWLLAHGSGLPLPGGGLVTLLPLGLTALTAALLYLAGQRTVRVVGLRDPMPSIGRIMSTALSIALWIALPYAALVAALTAVLATAGTTGASASGDQAQLSVARAVAGALVLALVAAGSGAWRSAPAGARRRSAWATGLGPCVRAGVAAVLALCAGGAALVGLALAVSAGEAAAIARAVAPDPLAGAGLLVLQVLMVPNAAVWGAAYAVGPGVAVGSGTAIGLGGASHGALPALPLLAALPAPGGLAWPALAALAVPVAAGVLAGRMVRRSSASRRPARALAGAAAGVLSGLVLALLCALAGGSVGDGRLQALGPPAVTVGLAAACEVGVIASVVAALPSGRQAPGGRVRRR